MLNNNTCVQTNELRFVKKCYLQIVFRNNVFNIYAKKKGFGIITVDMP